MPRSAEPVWRLRAVACCVALSALSFAQQPGAVVADTKVDLAVAPGRWLAHALHAWEPAGNFGQMQNQAYGYMWPMGPFFAAGRLLTMPAWVVQRLWWALLLCAAFTGAVCLAGRLGIGTPTTRLVGGLVFALSPRILSEIGPVSVEAWPSAIAPWVLLPLNRVAAGGSIRRAVTLSALAVTCAGGVNATAVFAVVPLAVLWLLTVHPLRRRVTVLAAWALAVGCATAWWLVPLLLLGRYSPPFLDFIETADVTTRATDVVTTARGASHWLAYLTGAYGPGWPAGWRLAAQPLPVEATMLIAGLGIAGLARPGLPHRRFLVAGTLTGLALVGLGHLSGLDPLTGPTVHAWLDAAGAPLRNVHKFDVVLRLPLTLGLVHLLGVLGRAVAAAGGPARRAAWLRAAGSGAATATALAVVASPALAGGLPGPGSFPQVPEYWRSAAAWLDARLGTGRVLVVPGARFPSYLWGAPGDEIVQPLLASAWAVRNSVPLTPPGTIRLLDTVESALATGAGSPGLVDLLARSGVSYLLVRADLDEGRSDTARQVAVRTALSRSPGLVSVATFGPLVGGQPDGWRVDRGLDLPVPALEVFQVVPAARPVVAYDLADARTVVGGPESLLDLAATGELGAAPAVLAGDLPPGVSTGGLALTDGLRRREVSFGRARDNTSATLTADAPWQLPQPAHDYLPSWAAGRQTVVRYLGIRDVTASSSYADVRPMTGNRPQYQPFAAVDGDPETSWRAAPGTVAAGQWLQVRFDRPRPVTAVTLRFDAGAEAIPTRVSVQAGDERRTASVRDGAVTVRLPGRFAADAVRVTIDAAWTVRLGTGSVGITELTIAGVHPQRTLVVPGPADVGSTGAPVLAAQTRAETGAARDPGAAGTRTAPVVSLSVAPSVPSCFFVASRPYCSPAAYRASEDGAVLDRTVPWPSVSGEYAVRLWARPRTGPALSAAVDRALAGPDIAQVTASSVGVADPSARPGAVVDGDPGTTWYAGPEDQVPWLRLVWPGPRTLTGLRLTTAPDVGASRPVTVTVLSDAGVRSGFLDEHGVLDFGTPLRTGQLTVLLTSGSDTRSLDPYAASFERLPIGVGEITALGAEPRTRVDPQAVVTLPCGSGPALEVAGRHVRTAVTATVRDLLEQHEVAVRLCADSDRMDLAPVDGSLHVVATGSGIAEPTRLVLAPADAPPVAVAPVDSVTSIDRWTPTQRRVRLAYRDVDRLVVLRENTNAGWRATLDGRILRPIVVDGWQQGWIVPAGRSGEVTIEFAPDRAYRIGLVGGAVLVGCVALAALAGGPRGGGPVGPVPGPVPVRRRRRKAVRPGWLALLVVGGAAVLALGELVAVALALVGLLVAAGLALAARAAPDDRRRRLRRAALAGRRWTPVLCFALACLSSLRSATPHEAVGPQLAGLAAFVALWLGAMPTGSGAGGSTGPG